MIFVILFYCIFITLFIDINVDRIEGRNKFLITVTKTVPITSQTDNPELFDNFTADGTSDKT